MAVVAIQSVGAAPIDRMNLHAKGAHQPRRRDADIAEAENAAHAAAQHLVRTALVEVAPFQIVVLGLFAHLQRILKLNRLRLPRPIGCEGRFCAIAVRRNFGARRPARKIEDKGARALTAKADVSDPQAVHGMFDAVEAAFGGVDVLVNNAGIMPLSTIADTDDATFERLVDVNLKGTFNTLREAARRLRDGGRIINFSSSVVALLQPTYGVYAGTKAAVEAMTSILSKELRGRNITVNAVAPGPTATDLFLHGKPQEVVDRFAK
ncbi:MAG TPA: SDR family NAD(P)-dependent oxidoreductase, partial [Stellaceae bacterium]|nr:SDR family NAD(P)-dependent oxidoreductase [Stellaceae bacterium]